MQFISRQPVPRDVRRACAAAFRAQQKLFTQSPRRVVVVIAHTNREWRRACREYYFPIAKAAVLRNGTLVLKSRTLARCSAENYRRIILHEMSHVFWCCLFRGSKSLWAPFWLVEGLACLSAENHYLLSLRALGRRLKAGVRLPLPYRYTACVLKVHRRAELALLYSYWAEFARWLSRGRMPRLIAFVREFRRKPSRAWYRHCFEKHFRLPERSARGLFGAHVLLGMTNIQIK